MTITGRLIVITGPSRSGKKEIADFLELKGNHKKTSFETLAQDLSGFTSCVISSTISEARELAVCHPDAHFIFLLVGIDDVISRTPPGGHSSAQINIISNEIASATEPYIKDVIKNTNGMLEWAQSRALLLANTTGKIFHHPV